MCVDGWALRLFPVERRVLQANCNASGFSLGFFVGSGLFLSITDREFCNKWFGLEPISHALALQLVAGFIISSLVLVIFLTSEEGTEETPSIVESYSKMVSLFRIQNFRIWMILLLRAGIYTYCNFLWVRSDKSVVSNQPQVGWSRTDMRSVRDFLSSMSTH